MTMQMNRERRRAIQKESELRLKLPAGKLEPINLSLQAHPKWMTRAFQNNRYTVMIDDNAATDKGPAIRVMVQRHADTVIPGHWREMQNIKNELFGEETMAIEYYPKESDLVDDHNIYWFWVYPEGIIPKPLNH